MQWATAVGLEKNVTENRQRIENREQRTDREQRNQLQSPLLSPIEHRIERANINI